MKDSPDAAPWRIDLRMGSDHERVTDPSAALVVYPVDRPCCGGTCPPQRSYVLRATGSPRELSALGATVIATLAQRDLLQQALDRVRRFGGPELRIEGAAAPPTEDAVRKLVEDLFGPDPRRTS